MAVDIKGQIITPPFVNLCKIIDFILLYTHGARLKQVLKKAPERGKEEKKDEQARI